MPQLFSATPDPKTQPPLPSVQHRYEGLEELSESVLHARREKMFLVFAGLFLGSLTMLNILGISRFLVLFQLDHDTDPLTPSLVFAVAVGVLPYPVTFLCTDFISELYGKARASLVVWIGLLLNLWVLAILWLGGVLPGTESPAFFEIRTLAFGAVIASMIAYLIAQLVDVHVFHFWKRVTKGKHLWLRNNGSTLVSQLIDTVAVILITYQLTRLSGIVDQANPILPQLTLLILTGYAFKFVIALLDTIPFYLGVPVLSRYLRLPPPTQTGTIENG